MSQDVASIFFIDFTVASILPWLWGWYGDDIWCVKPHCFETFGCELGSSITPEYIWDCCATKDCLMMALIKCVITHWDDVRPVRESQLKLDSSGHRSNRGLLQLPGMVVLACISI